MAGNNHSAAFVRPRNLMRRPGNISDEDALSNLLNLNLTRS